MARVSPNYIDLIVLAVLGLYFFSGYRRGFVRIFLELAAFLASFVFAFFFFKPVGDLLASVLRFDPRLSGPAGFVGAWLLGQTLLGLALRALHGVVPEAISKSLPNRLVGALLSTAQGGVVVGLLLLLAILSRAPGLPTEAIQRSAVGGAMVHAVSGVQRQVVSLLRDVVKDSLPLLTVRPESNETLDLGFKTDQFRPRPDLEREMLRLVNQERVSRGLKPLRTDPGLVRSGRAHSADMLRNGYFSHTDPKGGSPGERIHRAGVDFLVAGENLAFAPTLDVAHTGLMKSPGHRRNILGTEYGRLGVGILDADPYGLMITQHFGD